MNNMERRFWLIDRSVLKVSVMVRTTSGLGRPWS